MIDQPRPWVVVGNPENRRVAFFQAALASRGLPPAIVLSYHDVLAGRASLDAVPHGAFVRIDSPGENFAVEKQLLAAGEAAAAAEGGPVISRHALADLDEDHGRILYPRQWFLGYAATLAQWQAAHSNRADVCWTSHPADIALMFDKAACHAHCDAACVPVPPAFDPVASFDELHARMTERRLGRMFVKLAHSSSASGVAAIYHRRDRWTAITSTEVVRDHGELRLYNSMKLRRYADLDGVRTLVDALAPHRIHVEEWLPKATLGDRVFDLRVLVIAGFPRHMVVRTSRSPLTNLHLGNRRGSLEGFLERLPSEQLAPFVGTCTATAELFPGTLHAGLDILFTPGFRRHAVLEVNAFGDLLPGVLHREASTYELQLDLAPMFAAMPRQRPHPLAV